MPDPTASEFSDRRIAVVTGSSRGIGAAIALRLGRSGYHVVLHGRTESENLRAVASQLSEMGATFSTITCDFSKTPDLEGFAEACWAIGGRVDAWVQAAGADILTTEARHSGFAEKLERLWQVDVAAAARLLRTVAIRMKHQTAAESLPAILTIGWDQAAHGFEGDAGLLFGTVKGAVAALTRSLASFAAPSVRVHCIAPGWVKTAWGESADLRWQARAAAESLLRRWATPEDVAALAAFLVSPEAAFLNGQVIDVNGGFAHGRSDLTG